MSINTSSIQVNIFSTNQTQVPGFMGPPEQLNRLRTRHGSLFGHVGLQDSQTKEAGCRCLSPSLLRDILSSKVCRQGSTTLELHGTRNTKIQTGTGCEFAQYHTSCVVCIALGVDDCLEGVPACPFISGGTGLHGKSQPSTVGVLLQHNRVVSFVLQLVLHQFEQLQKR